VVADGGCPNVRVFKRVASKIEAVKKIRARHETIKRRLKQVGVVGFVFRHRKELQTICSYAVVNVVQISLQNGHLLFSL